MAKCISKSFFNIGNCKVEIEGNCEYEQGKDKLQISIPSAAKLKISVDKPRKYATRRSHKEDLFNLHVIEGEGLPAGFSFECLNPKDTNSQTKVLLEEVLKLYNKELPTMSYAANTGKESQFVERCVTGGKYCSLLLTSDAIVGTEEVIAAITYQILTPGTQYAEIPLAAVGKKFQHKGFGRLLYGELKKRLEDVGVLTLFCWGDQESEGFWLKQGFSTVAEVDGKGKARKLPIKSDVRRAMSMPGSATLLVAHLNGDSYASGNTKNLTPPRHIRSCRFLASAYDHSKCNTKASPVSHITTPIVTEAKTSSLKLSTKKCCFEESVGLDHKSRTLMEIDQSLPCENLNIVKIGNIENSSAAQDCTSNDGMGASEITVKVKDDHLDRMAEVVATSNIKRCDDSVLEFCKGQGIFDYKTVDSEEAMLENSTDIQKVNTPYLPQRRGIKRNGPAEQTYSKSIKVTKDYQSNDITSAEDDHNVVCVYKNKGGSVRASSVSCTMREPLVEVIPSQTQTSNLQKEALDTKKAFLGNLSEGSAAELQQPVIMLMNMADERKRMKLTEIVEKLGGAVSSVGDICTHVVTGQVRRTLNFCTALCSGAWVVSPDWLKASFKANKFVDEMPFILRDKAFESKYEKKVEDVVLKGRANPHKLLDGFHVYLTPHVQPPVEALSAIVKSAGGQTVGSLEKAQDPSHTFALTCGEDMSEALAAAMTGMSTFSSDWFMCCIMKQEFDFNAPQFTESL